MSWVGKTEPDAETINVAVICRLLSTPLMGTVAELSYQICIYFLMKHRRVGFNLV